MSKPIALLAALLLAAPGRVHGAQQEVQRLADSVAVLSTRAKAASEAVVLALATSGRVPDDSITLSGATLLFVSEQLPPRERDGLARTFARVERRLRAELGPEGSALLAETRWQLTVNHTVNRTMRRYVSLLPVTHERRGGAAVLSFPLDGSYVAELVRRHVGERLAMRSPMLNTWLGGNFSFREPALSYYVASRELALQGTDRSRRCARGTLEDCAVILDHTRVGEWFTTPARGNRRPPASVPVRESLLQHALDEAGPAVIAAVAGAAATSSPVTTLSAALGQSPEEFLAGWQAKVAAAGEARVRMRPGMFLSATLWVALFAVVATRRRPR